VLHKSFATLFRELIDGPGQHGAWMLNGGDVGLLRSLDGLAAEDASAVPLAGGASIAAHVEHLRFGLSLMNRWARGEQDPWSSADWAASWRCVTVDDQEWVALRAAFGREAQAWLEALATPRECSETELNDVIGSVAHLAYHMGAIRQMNRSIRGPLADGG
jgi:hypothetical protein